MHLFQKTVTCTCNKLLMKSVLVCEIRLKILCVDQVSINSQKSGRKGFRQSMLTNDLKQNCTLVFV